MSQQKPNLGDLEVVRDLVFGFADAVLERHAEVREGRLDADAAKAANKTEAKGLARAFMGGDDRFDVLAKWHTPQKLGAWLKRQQELDVDERDAAELTLLRLAIDLIGILDEGTADFVDPIRRRQLDAAKSWYARLFVGE